MQFGCISISYQEACIEEREQLRVSEEHYAQVVRAIQEQTTLIEVAIVSTCNRFEVYFTAQKAWAGANSLKEYFIAIDFTTHALNTKFQFSEGAEAIEHLCRVAVGLESMVIGEPQILGQVKRAYQLSRDCAAINGHMNTIFQRVFCIAKRVRRETKIGYLAVSVGNTAVDLIKQIFDTLHDKYVLIIGAGEMAEIALQSLCRESDITLLVANRTFSNAVSLAKKYNGSAIEFSNLEKYLHQVDVVLSSTGSREYILTADAVRHAMKKRRYEPMFFVDIAVPRDIDPAINDMTNAYVYDMDDLQNVVCTNVQQRKEEASKAAVLIEESLQALTKDTATREVAPLLQDFREHIQNAIHRELSAPIARLGLTAQQQENLEQLLHNFSQKLLHKPTLKIRERAQHEDYASLDLLCELFDLQHTTPNNEEEADGRSKIISFR